MTDRSRHSDAMLFIIGIEAGEYVNSTETIGSACCLVHLKDINGQDIFFEKPDQGTCVKYGTAKSSTCPGVKVYGI